MHDVSDGSNEQASEYEWASHLDAVADPRCDENYEEGQEVGRDGEELRCHTLVPQAADDGREEQRETVDRDQDEEEVNAHHNSVNVEERQTNLPRSVQTSQ